MRASTEKWLWGITAGLLLGCLEQPSAAVDMFLKLPEIPGEARDSKHGGEIDVLAWSWGLSQSGTAHPGGGAGAGKAAFQDLSFTKWLDKATPKLMTALASGKRIPTAVLTVRKAGGKDTEFYFIELKNVLVTSLGTGGSAGEDRFTENVGFGFEQIQVTYLATSTTDPGNPGGVKSTFSWDVAKNVEATSAFAAQGYGVFPAAPANGDGATFADSPLGYSAAPGQSLKAVLTFDRRAGTATLNWNSIAGAHYEVLFGSSLNAPMKSYRMVPADGDGLTTLTVPMPAAFGFFQVREVPRDGHSSGNAAR